MMFNSLLGGGEMMTDPEPQKKAMPPTMTNALGLPSQKREVDAVPLISAALMYSKRGDNRSGDTLRTLAQNYSPETANNVARLIQQLKDVPEKDLDAVLRTIAKDSAGRGLDANTKQFMTLVSQGYNPSSDFQYY
jgi:hypothetical protein